MAVFFGEQRAHDGEGVVAQQSPVEVPQDGPGIGAW
jgi:hypothetical protein